MKKSKKVMRGIYLILGCCVPMMFIAGCGITDTIKCTWCGDSTNRVLCYSSGTYGKMEYRSCVGPSGCVGFGCNTHCLPVECMNVKETDGDQRYSGTIYYYNSFGCVDEDSAKSYGEYSKNTTCLGCNCAGEKYVEDVTDEKSEAYTKDSCLGVSCGDKEYVQSRNANKVMPRQFPKGCWSCSAPEEN